MAGAGDLIGVAVGISATHVAAALGSWEALISWPATSMAFAFSLTVGVVFGLYPAVRASRLEPIEALRSE